MSGAGKVGDRGGGREGKKSLNKSKKTKFAIETQKKIKQVKESERPKYSPHPYALLETDPPVNMIDGSSQLLNRQFDRDLNAVMRRAKDSQVGASIVVSDWSRVESLMNMVKQWPGQMFACIGVSPDQIKKHHDKVYEQRMEQLLDLALSPECVAIACGLDLNRDIGTHFLQSKLFTAQIQLARQIKLPVVIWEKGASLQVVEKLKELEQETKTNPQIVAEKLEFPKVAIHGFNGTESDLKTYLESGCYIMINGLVCDARPKGEGLQQQATPQQKKAQEAKLKEEQRLREEEEKLKKEAIARGEIDEDEEDEEDDDNENDEDEEDEESKSKEVTHVGPPDLEGTGAHFYHLLRSGLLPLDRLLVASDAPFHTPQNIADFYIRTSRNEPSNIPFIFQQLAKAYNLPAEQVTAQVFQNAKSFFQLLNAEEFKIMEEKRAEKERLKALEEKRIINKLEQEARDKMKELRQEEQAQKKQELTAGNKKKKQEQKLKQLDATKGNTAASDEEDEENGKKNRKKEKQAKAAAAAAKKDEDSDDDDDWGKQGNKKKGKGKQAKKKPAGKKGMDSDDEDEDLVELALPNAKKGKGKAPVAPSKSAGKKKAESEDESSSEESSSEDSDEDDKKSKAKKGGNTKKEDVKKKAKKVESSSSESSSESEEDLPKPVQKKKKAQTVAAKKKKADSSSSESSSSESSDSSSSSSSSESDSDSDSDSDDGKKNNGKASKRARRQDIKAREKAERAQRVNVGQTKANNNKKKMDEDEDELEQLLMQQQIGDFDLEKELEKQIQLELELQKKQKKASKQADDAKEVDDAEEDEDEEDERFHGGVDPSQIRYLCKKCRKLLFTGTSQVPHSLEMHPSADGRDIGACEGVFISRPDWLTDDMIVDATTSQTIDVRCPKCSHKFGRYTLTNQPPLLCSCGHNCAGQLPHILASTSRLDVLATSNLPAGPRAMNAEELEKRKADEAAEMERWRQAEKARLKEKMKNKGKLQKDDQRGNFSQFRNKTLVGPVKRSKDKEEH